VIGAKRNWVFETWKGESGEGGETEKRDLRHLNYIFQLTGEKTTQDGKWKPRGGGRISCFWVPSEPINI